MALIGLIEASLAIVILYAVPGMLVTWALLRGVSLGRFAKLFFGFMAGIIGVPLLAALEFTFLNIPYSLSLLLANSLLACVIALLLLYREYGSRLFGAHTHAYHRLKSAHSRTGSVQQWREWLMRHWPLIVAIGLALLAFWVRYDSSHAYNFFEFDPIYYDRVTQSLLTSGNIPAFTQDVYFPAGRSMRSYPLLHFITGSWISTGAAFGGYDIHSTEFISAASQLYPPLAGAAMVLLAYLLFSTLFYDVIGLVAAAVFAFIPQLVKKMAAGVSALQPFGLFAALLIFVVFVLALHYRSRRLSVLGAFAMLVTIFGSAHGVWPAMVMAAFIAIASFLDYWNESLTTHKLFLYLAPAAGGLLGGIALVVFQNAGFPTFSQLFARLPNTTLALFAGVAAVLLLFAAQEFALPRLTFTPAWKNRAFALGCLAILGLIAFLTVPVLNQRIVGSIEQTAAFAVTHSALSKTIQEEAPTSPDVFPSSFGSIDPNLVLLLGCTAIVAWCAWNLFSRGKKNAAYAALALLVIAVFLNSFFSIILQGMVRLFFANNAVLADFVANSAVFTEMMVLIVVLAADSMLTGAENQMLLLMALFIFPVSYIGLRKLKYLVHLSLTLALALPLMLGMMKAVVDRVGEGLSTEADRKFLSGTIAVIVLLAGLLIVYTQVVTVNESKLELANTRISDDWMGTFRWMQSTPTMSDDACLAEYGYKCRVLAWWDYGHWITYFGQKQAVLDPGNYYPDYDQEVARAFVNGNLSDMLYTAKLHQATHVLVDAQLIQKWGALVFLSGSCSHSQSPTCPAVPDINFSDGPGAGKSAYEAEHYHETLSQVGNCPASVSPVAMPAFQSSLTRATFCFGQNQFFLLTQNGLAPNFSRKYVLVGSPQFDANHLDPSVSYLEPIGQGTLINANPDLSYAGLNNRAFYAAFTRMYLFESLPGFSLAYKSPNGEVKVFKISKDFIDGKTDRTSASVPANATGPAPRPSPSPIPLPPVTNSSGNATVSNVSSNPFLPSNASNKS